MRSTLLIVAAGAGTRLQAGVHKALAVLGDGRTLLEHCLQSVADARDAGALDLAGVVVVIPAESAASAPLQQMCRGFTERSGITVGTVPGGAERADSVRAGLAAVRTAGGRAEGSGGPFGRHAVLVHDAARPFVPPEVFRAVTAALEAGATAVVPALPVVDTIKTVAAAPAGADEADTPDVGPGVEWVTGTPSRAGLRAIQTPQGFELTALEAAHRVAAGADGLTDDAMVMEAAGHGVAVVAGDPRGFKVTTPLDLVLAGALLAAAADDRPGRAGPEETP